MSESGNSCLFLKHCIAAAAVTAFHKAGRRTRCGNGFIRHGLMPERRNVPARRSRATGASSRLRAIFGTRRRFRLNV